MTFYQWWKEYCVKHSIQIGSSFEIALKNVAYDAWDEAYFTGAATAL